MNIGNHIHTANNKKTYRKPVMEVVEMDRDIVLMGGATQLEEPPFSSQSNPESTNDPYNKNNKIFPESDNPFGGSGPDYER